MQSPPRLMAMATHRTPCSPQRATSPRMVMRHTTSVHY